MLSKELIKNDFRAILVLHVRGQPLFMILNTKSHKYKHILLSKCLRIVDRSRGI